jgi:RimJ/RimL family protein N-acetyltransferase
VIETARLTIRRIVPGDAAALHAVYGDAEAMRWVGDGQPLSFERCEEWVKVSQKNYAARGYGMFALEDRATGAIVGFAGLVHPGGQADPELKYALARGEWGRGYATEAARALLDAFVPATRVIATAAPENLASHRVLEKAGLRPAEPRRNDDGSITRVFVREPGRPAPP